MRRLHWRANLGPLCSHDCALHWLVVCHFSEVLGQRRVIRLQRYRHCGRSWRGRLQKTNHSTSAIESWAHPKYGVEKGMTWPLSRYPRELGKGLEPLCLAASPQRYRSIVYAVGYGVHYGNLRRCLPQSQPRGNQFRAHK